MTTDKKERVELLRCLFGGGLHANLTDPMSKKEKEHRAREEYMQKQRQLYDNR